MGLAEDSEDDEDIENMGEEVAEEAYRDAEVLNSLLAFTALLVVRLKLFFQESGIKIEPFNMSRELKDGVIDIKSGAINTRRKGVPNPHSLSAFPPSQSFTLPLAVLHPFATPHVYNII